MQASVAEQSRIPPRVHYCWFGGRSKPAAVLTMMDGWRRVLPRYEFVEWNEQNFPLHEWPYALQAHRAGKFAFTSDVARLYALATQGGIYLDTDVEVVRSFDTLLSGETVLGFEEFGYVATSTMVAPAGSRLMAVFLESYRNRSFVQHDDNFDLGTNVQALTRMLEQLGLRRDGREQLLEFGAERIRILEQTRLSPLDYANGIDKRDGTTFAVHHFGQSWASPSVRIRRAIRSALIGTLGGYNLMRIRRAISREK